jgi:hypothetical protein
MSPRQDATEQTSATAAAFPDESAPRYMLRDREDLRRPLPASRDGYEHHRALRRPTQPLAESLRRAAHWLDPTRVPESCYSYSGNDTCAASRPATSATITRLARICARKGRTRRPARPGSVGWHSRAASGSRRPAPPLPPPSHVGEHAGGVTGEHRSSLRRSPDRPSLTERKLRTSGAANNRRPQICPSPGRTLILATSPRPRQPSAIRKTFWRGTGRPSPCGPATSRKSIPG